MTIFYSVIARGDLVLCEHSVATGNFISVSSVILGRIAPNESRRMSYAYDTHTFHFIVHEKVTFMAMTSKDYSRRLAFGFLDDIKLRFFELTSPEAALAAPAYAYKGFAGTLAQQVDYYTNDPSAVDSIEAAKAKLGQVKAQSEENVGLIEDREGELSVVVDQSEGIKAQSYEFKEKSKKLKCAMLMRSIKCWIVLIILVAIAIWLVSSIVCGFDYSEC
mmetsp:Transcript_36521/g.50221  ORF Transcript_36521/g.50221 Transcript_36521/m.50221 type:complete len:219 (-) Transcript_36521:129-785(-)